VASSQGSDGMPLLKIDQPVRACFTATIMSDLTFVIHSCNKFRKSSILMMWCKLIAAGFHMPVAHQKIGVVTSELSLCMEREKIVSSLQPQTLVFLRRLALVASDITRPYVS